MVASEVLAIVPARGGSKSIPHKNIRPFAGHPLLAYSIAAGRGAELVRRVVVTTDDEEIARTAKSYGAEVPFMRPASLAQDDTLDLPVFQHALNWLASEEGYRPELVVQLRPTSPIRPPSLVDEAIRLMLDHPEVDSVRGVVPSGQNPYKMWRIDQSGFLTPLLKEEFEEPYNMPRQKLPQTYWQTGHIDVIRASAILEKGTMSGDVILPILLDPRYTVDIDTLRDWRRAEWLVKEGELEMVWPGRSKRTIPDEIELLVLDFDGVMTDDRVWVDGQGNEWVAAHRGDGWGLARLRETGIEVCVLSSETNPVVSARCRKLNIPVVQGVIDKGSRLRDLLEEKGVDPAKTIYLGNDVNDLPCFGIVGWALAVADAHPRVLTQADRVLGKSGGAGAVRELCELLIAHVKGCQ